MVRPIDGQASLLQSQNVQEQLQTAQREAAIVADRHSADTKKAKDTYETTVTKSEEGKGKVIRDDDPSKGGKQRSAQDSEDRPKEETPPGRVDIQV